MKPPKKPRKGKVLNQIRRIRLARTALTQEELGKRVGATRQTIIAIEAGKYAPSMELAFRIVREFDVPFEEIFQFEASL
ncbi:MAG: helix-turn-helix transcriptional regulator [Robiginitomaculum sp.]|nr:helix-turn-helix transcriptional regulator [Robiginitomaculum sp.]